MSQFCPNCGAPMRGGATFCVGCGTLNKPLPPMKWYKFLIYFALFAFAIGNCVTALRLLTGSIYNDADSVYLMFPGLHALDIILGLLCLAWAVLAIYTRFQLAGFYAKGPTLLILLYGMNLAIRLIQLIGTHLVMADVIASVGKMTDDIGITAVSVLESIIMMSVNKFYFDNRKSLFVN